MQELYSIDEIATAVGAKPATVSQWRRRGKLPQPDVLLAIGPIWYPETIRPWIEDYLREQESRPPIERVAEEVGAIAVGALNGLFWLAVAIAIGIYVYAQLQAARLG